MKFYFGGGEKPSMAKIIWFCKSITELYIHLPTVCACELLGPHDIPYNVQI